MEKVIHIMIAGHLNKKPGLPIMGKALVQAQSNLGIDASLWQISDQEDLPGLNSRTFPKQKNRLKLSPCLKKAVEDLPDGTILHVHDGFVPEFFALSKLLRKSGKHRLVLSSHGTYSEIRLRRLSLRKKAYYYLFERSLIKNASLVHLVGPAEVSGYNFFMDKITPFVSLPNGLADFDPTHAFSRDSFAIDKFIITYAGAFEVYEKGLDVLIQSFAVFSEEIFSPVELWLIGKGRDESDLRRTIKNLGLEDKVKFLGDTDKQTRKTCLLKSNAFVQPSRIDCVPTTALEAASLGLPLIVSEETNLGGLVRQYDAGWSLTRNDVESLTQIFHDVYFMYQTDEAAYLARNHNSYRMLREELNWNSLAYKWKEVYSGLS